VKCQLVEIFAAAGHAVRCGVKRRRDATGYETITVVPVTPQIGAEIGGIDFGERPSNRQLEELHAALLAHQVLFFRDQQKLDLARQKAFARHFGELHVHPNTPGPPGHPEVLPIHADASSKRINGEM
jgi:taurine dioxygenase